MDCGYKVISVRPKEETIDQINRLVAQTNRSRNELTNILIDITSNSMRAAETEDISQTHVVYRKVTCERCVEAKMGRRYKASALRSFPGVWPHYKGPHLRRGAHPGNELKERSLAQKGPHAAWLLMRKKIITEREMFSHFLYGFLPPFPPTRHLYR